MSLIKKIYRKIPDGKIKKSILFFYNAKSRIKSRPELPHYLQVEVTTFCNLNCVMCRRNYFIKNEKMKLGDMSFENFKKILDKIPSIKEIDLQGVGEPFLNKDIFKMIKYAKDKDLRVITVTNATLISHLSEDIVKSGLDLVKISFYGSSAETYDVIMKNSSIENVMKNIKKLNDVKKKLRVKTPTLELTMGLMHNNLHDLPKLPEIMNKIGVDKIILGEIYGYGKPVILTKEVNDIIKEFEIESKKFGIKYIVNLPKNVYDYTKICLWPWIGIYITWDGLIKPCCFRPYFVDFNFGNILNQNFEDVWNGEKYIEFRKKLNSKDVPMMCKGCQYDFSVFNEKNKTTTSK